MSAQLARIQESRIRGSRLAHEPDTRLAGEIDSRILKRSRPFSELADLLGEVVYRLRHGKHIKEV